MNSAVMEDIDPTALAYMQLLHINSIGNCYKDCVKTFTSGNLSRDETLCLKNCGAKISQQYALLQSSVEGGAQ